MACAIVMHVGLMNAKSKNRILLNTVFIITQLILFHVNQLGVLLTFTFYIYYWKQKLISLRVICFSFTTLFIPFIVMVGLHHNFESLLIKQSYLI